MQKMGYDKISQIYDISRAANDETVKILIKLLHVNSDSLLLDMGCGTGNYTAALHEAAKKIIGIDKSVGMIKRAQAKFPMFQFILGDITRLPFISDVFDGVFAIQVLHHIKKKETFLNEAHRVLRRGAYIALHSCSHSQMRSFWFCHYFPKGLELELARTPDVGVIASLLERAGFSDVGDKVCRNDMVVTNETPESYLDKNYRDGISTFSLLKMEEIEYGCKRLQNDITSGAISNIIQHYAAKLAIFGGSSIIYGQKI